MEIAIISDTHMPRTGRRLPQGCVDRLSRAELIVFGHSHIPLHERAPDGFEIFNPGSPTERRRSPRHTMGIGRVQEGRLSFELVALD